MLKPIIFQKNYWKFLLFPFLLFYLKSYSQKKDSLVKHSPNVIFLKGETLIYSFDESFNEQITKGTTLVKNCSIKYVKNSGKSGVVIYNVAINHSLNRDSNAPLKQLKKPINHNDLAKTLKIIAKYDAKLKNRILRKFENQNSEQNFSSSNYKAQYYLLPEVNVKKKTKKFGFNSFSLNLLLSCFIFLIFLAYFNKQALASCYLNAFKTRPPPIFS